MVAVAPNQRIPDEIEILKKFSQIKSIEVLDKEVHPGYETVRIAFIPPDLRITLRYTADASNMGNVIATYRPPAGMGDWTIDIHIPKKATTVAELQFETRYGLQHNCGTGAGNQCWKLVEIADAEWLNQSIYGTGFTGHIYYEGIRSSRGAVRMLQSKEIFEEAKQGTVHRQYSLAFCLEDRIAGMLRDACLGGRLSEAFAIVYDLAGQTHYKPPREYSCIKGKNVFYGKKVEAKTNPFTKLGNMV